jgi:hypothetical protein
MKCGPRIEAVAVGLRRYEMSERGARIYCNHFCYRQVYILGLLVKHATVGKDGITLYLVIMIAPMLGSVLRNLSGIVLRSWSFVYAARHHTIRGIA